MQTPVLQYKSGVKGGQNYVSVFLWWGSNRQKHDSVWWFYFKTYNKYNECIMNI